LGAEGEIAWKAAYSIPGSVGNVLQTADGGLAITGTTGINQNAKPFVLKLNSTRNVVFRQVFNISRTTGGEIFPTADNGFLIFRSNGPHALVSRVNSKGTAPGCNLFVSMSTKRALVGEVKVSPWNGFTSSSSLSLGISNVGITSTVIHLPESTECE
jgi:hypothetical protein